MNKPQKVAVLIVVGFPLVCCLGGVIFLFTSSSRAKESVEMERRSARKIGMPVDIADIQNRPIPDAVNAAPVYRKANELLNGPLKKAQSRLNAAQGKNASAKLVQDGKLAFEELKPVMSLVPDLDTRTQCDFRRDYFKGPSLLFPELASMKSIVKDLCFKADLQDGQGDVQGSLRSMTYAHRISVDAGSDPILIAMLVQIACRAISNREYERLIANHSRDASYLSTVESVIKSQSPMPTPKKYYGGEIIMETASLHLLGLANAVSISGEGNDNETSTPLKGFFRSPLVQNTLEAKILSGWRLGWSHFPNDPTDWEGYRNALKLMDDAVEKDRSPTSYINKVLFPVFSQSADAIGNLQAHDRMLLTSIELLKVRAQTGKLPAGLPSRLGKSGLDPFDGNPLRYRRKGTGFILYSIGRDRRDDGGHVRNPNDPEGTGSDEVLEFK